MTNPACRSCGDRLRDTVVDLGMQPLSNAYLRPDQVGQERTYPLHARFCTNCYLVQVDDVVSPEDIFEDYAYFSSFSETWLAHARRFTDEIVDRLDLGAQSMVVELASNDGYLLRNFVDRGIPALGVEPAKNVAQVAIERGVATEIAFFGSATAERLAGQIGRADLLVANNVLAHVPDLNDFVAGIAILLADGGVVSVEVPHLLQLVRHTQFDTIYHEHYSYFSLLAAREVLGRHGLEVIDVEELPTHGGSLRIFAARAESSMRVAPAVERVLTEERAAELDRPAGFVHFAGRVDACRASLQAFLATAHAAGDRVAAYGAAAKGNTLLNYAAVGVDDVSYVVDRNHHKQGLLLPGSHIPILAPSHVAEDRPRYLVILPWNLRDEVIEQMGEIRGWGGQFVVAIPQVEVIP